MPWRVKVLSLNMMAMIISPEWLNSFVIVKKSNGSLRICLDLIDLNKDIIRPICNSQTMDDVVHRLKGAKFFAVFDTSKGFVMFL